MLPVVLLYRYFLRQFLAASALVFLGLLLTWLTAQAILLLDEFRQNATQAAAVTLLRTLDVVPLGLPIACLTGAVWSLTRSAHFLELTACRSGGIRLRRLLAPIVVCSALLAIGVGFFEDRFLVPARSGLRAIEDAPIEETGGAVSFANDRWWVAHGRSLFSARSFEPDQQRLLDVTIFEFDEQRRIVRRIDADGARHREGTTWELEGARILDLTADGGPVLRREERTLLTMNLSRDDLARVGATPEALSLHRLARAIRETTSAAQRTSLERAFHSRLAQPWALVVLVLFALGISTRDSERRDTLGRALLRSLLAAIVYWTAWTSALLVAGAGAVPAALPVWGVTVLFVGLGGLQYRTIPE